MTPVITSATPLLLGSGSPRRREIVTALGLPFWTLVGDTDETGHPHETPAAYLDRIVNAKLDAVLALYQAQTVPAAAVLAADTIVVIDNQIVGKPREARHAVEILRQLAGNTHIVFTRFSVLPLAQGAQRRALTVASEVALRSASEAELTRYAASGEGLDKAGAYAVQGLGAFLVREIRGSPSNVIGLPACELVETLKSTGLLNEFPVSPLTL
jgi:septum formation protein